ncbi:MAG: hypothetical protein ABR499_18675 [Gemmatimonadaceae bacterium]
MRGARRGARETGRALLRLGAVVGLAVAAHLAPRTASRAQVPPNAPWRTMRTAHFAIHFTPELESIARRTAANAERAYAQLAAELVPPRGRIDIVVADNVDYSNGTASVFPSNRVYVYANPPVESSALRFNDDWNTLVVTHELTHVFHLDRVRGVWRLGQAVFGRAPLLFPNAYAPSWLTEGLAVYFESRLTGSGRLLGSEHRMIARSTALEHRFPRLDELSLATPRFPGGQVAYAYGSLIVDHLARTRGPGRVRDLVERTSGQIIPFLLDRPAARAFGTSFQRAWTELRDSVVREAGTTRPPLPGWRDLTPGAFVASLPRWLGDSAVVYTGATTRDVYGAYSVRVDARGSASPPRRLGRRNSRTANVPLGGGGLLYTQLDFTDPYHIRSDLYVDRGGRTRRLTRGARVSSADARADGSIVAAQAVPGGSRLVRLTPDGRAIVPLTSGGPDTQWMEPRWSPDGRRIVAATWRRGGVTSIVVLDTLGNRLQEIAPARSVQGAPSWSPDGSWILFSSDRSGTPDIYAARVTTTDGDSAVAADGIRVGNAPTGLFEPQLSPDGQLLGAILFRADGYHVGVAPFVAALTAARERASDRPVTPAAREIGAPLSDTGRVRRYSPWASLRPHYWLPLFEAGLGNGYRLGGLTSGEDLVGRHGYAAQLLVPTDASGMVGAVDYRYAGLGQPILGAALVQDWELRVRLTEGDIRRRTQDAVLTATVVRPRYRTSAALTFGAGVQTRRFAVVPPDLRAALAPDVQRALDDSSYTRAFVSGSWGNAYRSAYSISPEDGLTVSASVDQRWARVLGGATTRTYVGAATAYKSLDLPGFARHVVAVRVAGGLADRDATTALEVGGTSGGTLSVLPGYLVGTGRHTFPVRGFPAASLEGTRAVATSLELRAPLVIPARGLRLLPFFLDRTSLSVFYDAAAAWCPASPDRLCFPAAREKRWIASAGGELNVTAAVLSWDEPYRFRLGLARPVTRGVDAPSVSAYLAIGLAF